MRQVEIKLKPQDKSKILKLVNSGVAKARSITRCRILLLSAENKPPRFIAQALGCSLKTIQNVKQRYNLRGGLKGAVYDAPRSGAPAKFDGKARANITALACTAPPEGHAHWSLTLLADKAVELKLVDSISHTQVGNILKKK